MTPRARLAGGAAALLLCGQYLAAEAVAAAAWTSPYSYARNYISDLGVTACAGRGACSPLGTVMNAGFILSGILAIVAAGLLLPLMPSRAARRGVISLAVLHGLGSIVVGLVQAAPGTAAGTPRLHVYGAYAAIGGGNLALILVGLTVSAAWANRSYRIASLAFGSLGIASGLALVLTRGWPPGLLERGAVDTITLWEVGSGLLLALRLRRAAWAEVAA